MKKKKILATLLGGLSAVLVTSNIACIKTDHESTTVSRNNQQTQTQKDADSIKFMSYNIAHGRGVKNYSFQIKTKEEVIKNLDSIVEVILKENPDVIGLNEIDYDSKWSFGVNELEYIAEKADMPYYTKLTTCSVDTKIYPVNFGDAILSKYPISSSSSISYQAEGYPCIDAEKFLNAEIQVGNKKLNLIYVHFSPFDAEYRERQAKKVVERLRSNHNHFILFGDFNISPFQSPAPTDKKVWDILANSGLFFTLKDEWVSKKNMTFPSYKPYRLIDYILVDKKLKVNKYGAVDAVFSDHKPVICTIDFLEK